MKEKKKSTNVLLKNSFSLSCLNKRNLTSYLILYSTLIISSVLIGTCSAGFLVTLDWLTHFRETHVNIIYLLPIAGIFITYLYKNYGGASNAGTNIILENIYTPTKEGVPIIMAPLVYISTLITHLFGGSAGREGTAVQIAGALTDPISTFLKLSEENRKTLLVSSIAAGFGSVFGTPLAGAFFAIEVLIVGKLQFKSLIFTLLASFIADYTCTNIWKVGHTSYMFDLHLDFTFYNCILAIFSGICFGLCAYAYIKCTFITQWIYKKMSVNDYLKPVIGGIMVIILVHIFGSKYIGLGISTISESIQTNLPWYDFALKILLTALTLSSGFKGGEVTPLFFIGACLGNMLSIFIPIPLPILASLGFVAVFAGASKTPLACLILGYELFGPSNIVFISISCAVAFLFSGKNSIYSSQKSTY